MNKHTQSKSPMRVLNTCLWLVDKLQTNKRMTYKQLNDQWIDHFQQKNKAGNFDLEKRTLRYYWQYIDSMLNIVVRCDRQTNEYYIDESYDTKLTDWLLSSFSVSNILGESRDIQNRILLEDIPSGQKYLTSIIAAMKGSHPIELTYQKFCMDEPYVVKGDPLCLKLVSQRWYMLFRVPGKSYYGLYALDRIRGMQVLTDQSFDMPDGFTPSSLFEYSFGAFTTQESKSTIVRISVDDMQRKYWRTLPIHHSQKEEEVYSDHSIFTFHLQITPDFENFLLSMGSHAKVLSPRTLVEDIRQMHLDAAEQYDE